jgi:hypothetical protein
MWTLLDATGYLQRQPCSPPSQPQSSPQVQAGGIASMRATQLQGWQAQAAQLQRERVLVEVFIEVS